MTRSIQPWYNPTVKRFGPHCHPAHVLRGMMILGGPLLLSGSGPCPKYGLNLFCAIWTIFTIYHMGHFRLGSTSILSGPQEGQKWPTSTSNSACELVGTSGSLVLNVLDGVHMQSTVIGPLCFHAVLWLFPQPWNFENYLTYGNAQVCSDCYRISGHWTINLTVCAPCVSEFHDDDLCYLSEHLFHLQTWSNAL